MGYDSLFQRHELYVAAGALGAHASFAEGFRQRDVRFLVDLFTNWVETALQRSVTNVQNTQIQRYLESLAREGFARKITRGKQPHYRLTRIGLIELLTRISDEPQLARGHHFFFLFYFLRNYGPRLFSMVKAEGKQFPYSLKLEVERLLNIKGLLDRELAYAKKEMAKLNHRIEDAYHTSALMRNLIRQKVSIADAVKEVEKRYPYDLNSQKPLTELIASIPEDAREWELTEGTVKRAEEIWKPEYAMLKCYLEQLEKVRG
jgi:hypothetical protein